MTGKTLYIIFALIIVILIIAVLIFLYFDLIKEKLKFPGELPVEEKRLEKILESLTAPSEGREVSEEILKSVTAPSQKQGTPQVSKEIIDSLTAPTK